MILVNEVHHLDEAKVGSILAKFYVRDAPRGSAAAAYTWEETGFYKTFKRAGPCPCHDCLAPAVFTACPWEPSHSSYMPFLHVAAFSPTLLPGVAFKALSETGGSGATAQMKMYSAAAIGLWIAAFTAMCATGSAWLALLAGILLQALFGVGHNFFHQRNTWWRYAWDMTIFRHHEWRISHALSHHLYPVGRGALCPRTCRSRYSLLPR